MGGVGELLGHFFDKEGKPFETGLSKRVLALCREDLKRLRIVAVAGGVIKVPAVLSVLRSGNLAGLITDERTARALMEGMPVG
jgi:DNA-binding transcriptional regulator LsrR (DeoR family)